LEHFRNKKGQSKRHKKKETLIHQELLLNTLRQKLSWCKKNMTGQGAANNRKEEDRKGFGPWPRSSELSKPMEEEEQPYKKSRVKSSKHKRY